MLGARRAQLQELQVWAPQEGTLATYIAVGTSTAEQIIRARMANTIVLPKGVLATTNEIAKAVVSRIKGLGLNLAFLPQETLYQL